MEVAAADPSYGGVSLVSRPYPAAVSLHPPAGLGGPHAQTLWAHALRSAPATELRRQTLPLPDGDRLTLAWAEDLGGPLVLIVHGLTGSARSPYVRRLLAALRPAGLSGVVMEARGFDGLNRRPRFQHAGDTADLDAVAAALRRQRPGRSLAVVGYSVGGGLLLNWLAGRPTGVAAAAVVSVPFELDACTGALDRGFARLYQAKLLRGLKHMMRRKLARGTAGGLRAGELDAVSSLRGFDERVTAPLHGFADADDYYRRASCRPRLRRVATPTLLLQAADDPFVPAASLPLTAELPSCAQLRLSSRGGHLGFVARDRPDWLEGQIVRYLGARLGPAEEWPWAGP